MNYLAALKAHNGDWIDVRLGRFKDRTLRPCRRCGQPYECRCPREYRSYEEKETDVALGAMMVADAALRVADISVLVSADTDLAPALAAVQLVDPGRQVYLAMPPGNTGASRHLLGAGNVSWFHINESALRNAQLPNIVADVVSARTYARPAKWS